MHKYERIIYWSEIDKKFIVEVPELAGCMADGETAAEALENAEVIITEWLETAAELGRRFCVCKCCHLAICNPLVFRPSGRRS